MNVHMSYEFNIAFRLMASQLLFMSIFTSPQSVPGFNLTSPVTGGHGRGEDGMLRHTQAGLAVSAESVQHTSVVVVVEVSGAGGAP